MRHLLFVVITIFIFISCKESPEERQAMLPASSGNINTLQVVINDEMWNGYVGETIREYFAAPVDGLPQEEPMFSISQITPDNFSGFTQKNRTFLFIQKNDSISYKISRDFYAKPQTGIFISAPTNQEIVDIIINNAPEMIEAFKKTEIAEKQRRMSLSKLDVSSLQEKLGVSLTVPSAYRIAKETEDFFWLRKDIRTGTTNIAVYQLPLSHFKNEATLIGDIIRMRDSIGEKYIEGPTEGSYMITEEAYAPYLFTSEIDGKFAYETKGTWEVKNDFMAGPFVNYIVKDSANNRLLVLEGFTFAPSVSKRDYQSELEAIIRSAKIQ